MWVYRSGFMYPERQIILYEYQKTRNASHPRNFLKNYTGICVTDGYQVYHTLEKEREDLRIAGCWVHCRRRFHEALEVIPKAHREESILYLFMKQIQAIYREEGKVVRYSGRGTAHPASAGGKLTGGCFLCVPEAERSKGSQKRKNKGSIYLCFKSGMVSSGVPG